MTIFLARPERVGDGIPLAVENPFDRPGYMMAGGWSAGWRSGFEEGPERRRAGARIPPVSDEGSGLEARVEELERRMDSVMARIGYLPGESPIQHDEAKWNVSAEVLELAGSGKEKDLAKAILLHIKQTGAEPEPARQAVLKALGRDPVD